MIDLLHAISTLTSKLPRLEPIHIIVIVALYVVLKIVEILGK